MKNIFGAIPADLPNEVFDTLLENQQVKIERIVSKGHSSPDSGWYDQTQPEWVIVLQGEALITFDNAPDINLTAGDYLNIPARQKHRVSWTDPTIETIWLAIHY